MEYWRISGRSPRCYELQRASNIFDSRRNIVDTVSVFAMGERITEILRYIFQMTIEPVPDPWDIDDTQKVHR